MDEEPSIMDRMVEEYGIEQADAFMKLMSAGASLLTIASDASGASRWAREANTVPVISGGPASSVSAGEDYLLLDLMLEGPATSPRLGITNRSPYPVGSVRVVGREALKEMKRQAGRPQDLVEVERMENPDDQG